MGLLGARVPQLLWVQSQEDAGGVWKGTMAAGPSVSRYLRTALQTWKKGPLVRPLSTCQAPVAGNPSIRRLEVLPGWAWKWDVEPLRGAQRKRGPP